MKQKKRLKSSGKKLKPASTKTISHVRKRVYTVIALLIPVLFFLILELCLWIFNYGNYPKLFVPTPDENSEYYGINLKIGERYFYWSSFNPTPRKDLFLRKKPENCYRIFVLGGSTTAGFPYGNNLTFTRILNRRLADTFPDRRIEVVNTAMTAINSYALLDFMDEILEQKPDAILIYAGHNEFYGALGVGSLESLGNSSFLVRTYLKLQRFKSFLLIRDAIRSIYRLFKGNENEEILTDPMETEMSRIVKEQTIPFGSSLYESGKEQFQSNLNIILEKAKDAGVPVVISELVSNIRDQVPFISIDEDSLLSARIFYEKARALEKEGKYNAARKLYYDAKDMDALRFRAPEEFNRIISNLAEKFAVPLVPMKSYFEAASPNGLIGNNLMHEHLHPNIDGYFLMAEAFYNLLHQNKFISDQWDNNKIKPGSYYRENWGFTSLDSVYAALTILQLKGGWPFKKEGPNVALLKYSPESRQDSVVLKILRDHSLTLELGHIELARYYESRKEFDLAMNEYKALIYTVPGLDLFYEPALNLLLNNEQYEDALSLMNDALKYNESAFVLKWVGQLSLANGDIQRGILYLEKAKDLTPRDELLLYNLTRAYYNAKQLKKGDETLIQLKNTGINTAAIRELESLRDTISSR